MRLKTLELYGFKSFAEKCKLEFKDDFVAIVGPNGSGKSNISDAVRWVLGEQSAKSLRGEKMEDVIFNGGKGKPAMNLAQVDMVFDNSDGLINIPYEEIAVSRKLYRNGESVYLLNKSRVRRRDILELFLDTGIGKEGYSLIGQGRIDEILSSKSEDRRSVFEEAAGISKYKYKKQDSIRRLEKTEIRLNNIKADLTVKSREESLLKIQADNAKRGIELLKELDSQELSLLKRRFEQGGENLDRIEADLLKASADEESLKAELNKIIEELSPYSSFIEGYDREKDKLERKLRLAEEELNKAVQQESLTKEKMTFYRQDLERTDRNKEEKSRERDNLLREESLAEDRLKLLLAEKEEISNKLSDLREAADKVGEFSIEIEKLLTKSQSLKEALSILDFKKESELESDRQTRLLQEEEKSKLEIFQKEIEDLDTKDKEVAIKLKDIEDKLQAGRNRIEEINSNIGRLEEDLLEYDKEINKSSNLLSSNSSRENLLKSLIDHYEGYRKPVQDLLRLGKRDPSISRRYIGPLADLIKVKAGYETAIDYSLGAGLQNIVVENEEDAKYLINVLKERRMGRVTFLPINKIEAGRPSSSNYPEEICNAMEALEFDDSIRNILSHFLSRTSIVKDIDTALALSKRPAFSNRIVSLDGDIVNSWGSMVGGKSRYKQEAPLFNRDEDLKKIAEENKKLRVLINEKQEKKKEGQEDLIRLKREREEIYQNRDLLVKEDQALKEERLLLAYKKEDYKAKISAGREILGRELIFSNEEYVEKKKSYLAELDKNNSLINSLREKEARAGEESREVDKQLALLSQKSEVNERDLALAENRREEIREDISSLDQTLALVDEEGNLNRIRIEEGKRLLLELSEKRSQLGPEINLAVEEIEKLKNSYKDQSTNLAKLNEERDSLKEKLTGLSNEVYRLQVKKDQIIEELERIKEEYRSQYDLSFEEVDARLEKLVPVDAGMKKIKEIKQELSKIGFFNVESIDQYEELAKDLTFLREQLEDLSKSKADIEALIADLDKTMLELFNEHFEKINIAYDEIFRKLFRGGKARIYLDGEDPLSAGVEIEAQPPGKSLQKLNLLSGGERSMTALALLFAVFSIRPTPFCILDEIDASLDEANIGRYVEYLKTLTDKTQFIVITHRKRTMELAQLLYGITMEEGISKMLYLRLDDYKEEVK